MFNETFNTLSVTAGKSVKTHCVVESAVPVSSLSLNTLPIFQANIKLEHILNIIYVFNEIELVFFVLTILIN